MTRRRLLAFATVGLAIGIAVWWADSPSLDAKRLVGKWQCTQEFGIPGRSTWEFRPDGECSYRWVNVPSDEQYPQSITYDGPWRLRGRTIVMKGRRGFWDSVTIPVLQFLRKGAPYATFTIDSISDNEVMTTDLGGRRAAWTRVPAD